MNGLDFELSIVPVGPRGFTFNVKNVSDTKIDCIVKIFGDKTETYKVSIKSKSSWNVIKDVSNKNPQMQVEYGPPNARGIQYAI